MVARASRSGQEICEDVLSGKAWRFGPRNSRAFTLLEIIVAIGAVAIVTVGLAALFQTIGRTVSSGKKLSTSNAYAALLEQQMRADIAAITREGYLVIRQQGTMAAGGAVGGASGRTQNTVKVWADDPYPRVRRVDELMFFAHGDYQTQRPAVHPRLVAKSDTARIYYGHGVRAKVDTTTAANNIYLIPEPQSEALPGGGNTALAESSLLGVDDAANPDRYAANWTLLRHVTLLVPKNRAAQVIPENGWPKPLIKTSKEIADGPWQVSMQPATPTIFYPVNREWEKSKYSTADTIRRFIGGSVTRSPVFASGLVDIARTDLSEVRSWVTDLAAAPKEIKAPDDVRDPSKKLADQDADELNGWFKSNTNLGASDLPFMHTWMLAGMPAASDPRFVPLLNDGIIDAGQRIRYEDIGPNLLNTLRDATVQSGGTVSQTNSTELELAVRRADQLMLSAFRFLPRCTEFTVEWSFGQVGINGETLWYGSRQGQLPTTPGATGWSNDIRMTRYPGGYQPWLGLAKSRNSDLKNSLPDFASDVNYPEANRAHAHTIDPALIYNSPTDGLPANIVDPAFPQTMLFGYVDPSYVAPAEFEYTTTGGEKVKVRTDSLPGAFPATLPCPWPKLLRVTATLADAVDPSQSETFQFVFEVPGAGLE